MLIYLKRRVCFHIICLTLYVFVVVDSIFVGSSSSTICLGFAAILDEHVVMFLLPFKLGYDLVVFL